MNTEYLWWLLALLLAGGGMVAFLALGRVPEIEDEPAESPASPAAEPATPEPATPEPAATEPAATEPAATEPATPRLGLPQSSPESTTVPGPAAPASTSETP